MLFKRKPDQSQSISGVNLTNAQVQMGQAGNDLRQTQADNQGTVHTDGLSADQVAALLAQVIEAIAQAPLPEADKTKALAYLSAAQQETQEAEPDKDLIAKNLKRMGDTLQTASDSAEAGKTLWQTIVPLLRPLAGWLGTAATIAGL
ncbi:hypothetical protein [Nodosilinea sp. P-1105]|uniref:hypothetical protein n=1 Tax=Nodosilinea sp. P-1105 TaxID=2546229 RepID=UPI00146ED14D|nr:hypothetical protein [Nodosilinea sp. P-1105]NMF82410.1 hypothetical protein [Nodosilinea sp. P-1105]